MKDENVSNVIAKYKQRAQKGFEKYGVTTERSDIELMGWLLHLQEEMMDATVYIERIMNELSNHTKERESTQAIARIVRELRGSTFSPTQVSSLSHWGMEAFTAPAPGITAYVWPED
jgi:hypothetical protein